MGVSCFGVLFVVFFKQKTADGMRISDWSSDVCSSDLSQVRKRMLRPRVLIYSAVLGLIVIAFFVSLATRTTLRMDIIRDRGALGREVPGGMIENVYRLQIMNASESP